MNRNNLHNFHTTVSTVYRQLCEKDHALNGSSASKNTLTIEVIITQLVWTDRKATVSQIATVYNCGEQKKHLKTQTFRLMGYITTGEDHTGFRFHQNKTAEGLKYQIIYFWNTQTSPSSTNNHKEVYRCSTKMLECIIEYSAWIEVGTAKQEYFHMNHTNRYI